MMCEGELRRLRVHPPPLRAPLLCRPRCTPPTRRSYFEVSCKTGLNVDVMFMHLFGKVQASLSFGL
jgi:hypothetical protein